MCSICDKILVNFQIPHTEQSCPLRVSRYCSYCAQYGHITRACPAKPRRWAREAVYVEQLISPSELKEFNITSRTLINKREKEEEPEQLLEIFDSDKVIAEFLRARDVKVSKKAKDNRVKLNEYAQLNNMRLVLMREGVTN
jgi:hypothetical protein